MMTLLDIVLDASAIILIGLAAVLLLRKQSASVRHCVLATALLCAGVVPLVELVLPPREAPLQITLAELPAPWPVTPTATAPAALKPTAAPPAATHASNRSTSSWSVSNLMLSIWLLGAVVSVAALIVGLVRLAYLTRTATEVASGRWRELSDRLRCLYGIRHPIRVLESRHPGLLLVWGWRRPVLILPASARGWSEERMTSVIRHEFAHLRRGDWITQLAAELVRTIYWFNPLVWAACRRLHIDCEQACDDAVLAGGVDERQYATELLDIARHLRSRAAWMPAPAIVRASTLERRVKAMLDRSIDRRPLSRAARNVSMAVLLLLSLAVVTIAATQQFSSLTGTIVDPGNGLLPGVTLVLTSESTQAKYEIKSDRNGRYEFVGLPPGTYLLETKLPGFAVFRGSIVVGGPSVQQDLMLSVGTLQETITILGSDTEEQLTPEQQRAREERKLADERKAEEYRVKRAAAKCPGNPGSAPAIGGNIRTPIKLRDVRPRFPDRLRGTEGIAVLQAVIGTDGRVDSVDVVSTTHQEFAESAIEAVRQWQFDATLLNCTAIETQMTVTANFNWK
jgi:TonB family protein